MKPELAVLPLEVWADVYVYPCIKRKKLAKYVALIGNRKYAEKLQMLLHDPRCGKHLLRYLDFCESQKGGKYDRTSHASLIASSYGHQGCGMNPSSLEECEFPQTEMPENIRGFKQLLIRFFDDQVLDFMTKIKSLFTDVFICMGSIGTPEKAKNMRIVLDHLLPMVDSIREISCDDNNCIELMNKEFPDKLTLAKELSVSFAEKAYIPAYLDWLNAPQDYDRHGPRFLKTNAEPKTITAIIGAIRKQFLVAATSATFVIFLEFSNERGPHRTGEFTLENGTTKEQMVVRNAMFKMPKSFDPSKTYYAEIVRHSTGEDAKIRDWINGRAYYEKMYKEEDGDEDESDESNDEDDADEPDDEEESDEDIGSEEDENGSDEEDFSDEETRQMIWIQWPTIGRLTKKTKAEKRGRDNKTANVQHDCTDAGPSTSAAKKPKKSSKKAEAINGRVKDESDEEDAAGARIIRMELNTHGYLTTAFNVVRYPPTPQKLVS